VPFLPYSRHRITEITTTRTPGSLSGWPVLRLRCACPLHQHDVIISNLPGVSHDHTLFCPTRGPGGAIRPANNACVPLRCWITLLARSVSRLNPNSRTEATTHTTTAHDDSIIQITRACSNHRRSPIPYQRVYLRVRCFPPTFSSTPTAPLWVHSPVTRHW
jgi:hypothetical protein